ncbi:MAG: DUF167 domain-containing protein [Fimbriimonadales bacterium]|nr:DUF167 domain-containing protein [Fimbriimonadales bacterium]
MSETVRVRVRVTPRSSRNRLERREDGSLRAWVHAAPCDGEANEALRSLLAERLRIPKTSLRLVGGAACREKTFEVDGLAPQEVERRLAAPQP